MTTTALVRRITLISLLLWTLTGLASHPLPFDLQLVSPELLPTNQATWFSLQKWDSLPPSPFNWCIGMDNIFYYQSASLGTNKVVIDDTAVDYGSSLSSSSMMSANTTSPPPPPGGGGGGTNTNIYPKTYFPGFGSNDIWLEIEKTNSPGNVDISLHNPKAGLFWQLLTKTNIVDPKSWDFGEVLFADGSTNILNYTRITAVSPPMKFLKAVGGRYEVMLIKLTDPAVEPLPSLGIPGTNASFQISAEEALTNNITVYYSMSGSATPGIDYSNYPGTFGATLGAVVLTPSAPSATVQVQPLADGKVDFDELADFTLVSSNGYVVDPNFFSAEIIIKDNFGPTNIFQIVATNLPNPVGIEYSASNHSFILPINFQNNDPTFGKLSTNATLSTWSGIGGIDLGFEVRIATAPTTTNGLTASDLLFGNGNPGGVGWLSADGARSNLNWITISGETNLIESIYVDQTGIWSNDVLVVSGQDRMFDSITTLNIWRVHLRTNFQCVATIPTLHLEGLVTLPNDTRYGPWAGKLLTADENLHAVYAVDPSGSVSNYFLNIDADQIRVIPPTNDLYCVQFRGGDSRVLKVPRSYFADSVSDLLFEQAGETGTDPLLRTVHWDGSRFVTHQIDLWDYFPNDGFFEKVTFAPVSMPALQ